MKQALYLAYLKEQYDAARHHQTMRIATTALIFGASGAIFAKGMEFTDWKLAGVGAVLVVLGGMNVVLNERFHNANRLHSEIASWVRRIVADVPDDKDSACPDPNVVRKAVVPNLHEQESVRDTLVHAQLCRDFRGLKKKDEPAGSGSKIETSLNGPLKIIPWSVILAGVVLIGRAVSPYICFP